METLFVVLVILAVASALALVALQGHAENLESKARGIHQELIDAVVKETAKLDASEYDFIDTVACRVPGEGGILKRFECTSIYSSSTTGSALLAFGFIGGEIPIDAKDINPPVETVFLRRGDIIDVEISVNEERSSISSGQIGGRTGQALIGTALFGVAGGQIGASGRRSISMTSQEQVMINSLALEIFTRDTRHPYLFVHFFPNARSMVDYVNSFNTGDAVPSSVISDRNEYKQLKRWYSILLGLKDDSAVGPSSQSSFDMADQLSKLNDLKERGVITQQEFEEAKKKTLGLP
jgi:hypothetical protein